MSALHELRCQGRFCVDVRGGSFYCPASSWAAASQTGGKLSPQVILWTGGNEKRWRWQWTRRVFKVPRLKMMRVWCCFIWCLECCSISFQTGFFMQRLLVFNYAFFNTSESLSHAFAQNHSVFFPEWSRVFQREQPLVSGQIRSRLCWLTGSLETHGALHPVCLRHCGARPPRLFSFLFRQEDYSKESSKASSEGIIEQQQRD